MKYKNEKNPIQMVFKTVMNSAYGKTIMKPVEHDTEYVTKYNNDDSRYEQYVHRNHNQIVSMTKTNNYYSWKEEYIVKKLRTIGAQLSQHQLDASPPRALASRLRNISRRRDICYVNHSR